MTIKEALEVSRKQYNCWTNVSIGCPIQCEKCENNVNLADFLEALKTVLDAFGNYSELPNSSGDCISRQAAIDVLRGYFDGMLETDTWSPCDVYGLIEILPSAQAEQKWIPCSERLPENFKPVIVTWKNNDPASYYQYIVGKHFIGVAHYKNDTWYWYSSVTEDFLAEYGKYESEEFDEAIEVIAWMPLPEPYRGDNK